MPPKTPKTADATEKRLISEVYEFAKSIAELQLTESELALYSALVLLQPGKFNVKNKQSKQHKRRKAKLTTFLVTQPDRPDLRQVSHVRRLNLFISRSLRAELNKTHRNSLETTNTTTTTTTTTTASNGQSVYDTLIAKIQHLREISMLHMVALSRFRRLSPEIEFPALHRELFSMDINE